MAVVKYGFPEARLRAAKLRPYFAAALWRLIPVPKSGLGTMGIDRYGRCYYDPSLFESWTLDQSATVICHELLHRLVQHAKRADKALVSDHQKWNVAADVEINQMLREDGLDLPLLPQPKSWDPQISGPWEGKPCFPETIKGWQMVPDGHGGLKLDNRPLPPGLTAEEYYQILTTEPPKDDEDQSGGDGDGDGEESGEGSGDKSGSKPGDKPGPTGGKAQPNPTGGNDGSGADGESSPWEDGPPSEDHPGQTEIESEIQSREFAKSLQSTGKGGAGLRRWAGQILEPAKVNWDQRLRALIRDAAERRSGTDDTTFSVPNRRQWGLWDSGHEVCLPSGVSPIPEVFCVIDTSGSMSDDILQSILVEIKSVCQAVGAPVRAVCVDDRCYDIQKIEETTIVRTTGGGGTDMRLGIELARKQTPVPAVCIVLTDGYTPWPTDPDGRMAIIAVITAGGTNHGIPSFINTVNL